MALERLERQYKLPMVSQQPQVPYKETIRKGTEVHGRYKHQTGGHGAFGDVYLTIKPLERGNGFSFSETIVGEWCPNNIFLGWKWGYENI
ncbi:hypothetical protein NON20_04680 [Synechocystis sp. B12]|nr:hypothetical protein NON20_04680 [Synechocystis sp. B12]